MSLVSASVKNERLLNGYLDVGSMRTATFRTWKWRGQHGFHGILDLYRTVIALNTSASSDCWPLI